MDAVGYFPRGLVQPEGSFRFGQDALLLAALTARFHSPGKKAAVVELGCGCGAALFGLLLLWPGAQGLGLDCSEELLAAAKENALLLDLAKRAVFSCVDFTGRGRLEILAAAGFEAAIANPPWQIMGRPAKTALREQALRSPGEDILDAFFRAANFLLRARGHFYLILPAASLGNIFPTLARTGFGLRFVQPLRTSAKQGICKRIFILCRKGAKNDPQIFTQLTISPGKPQADGDWVQRVFQLQS